MGAFQVGQVFQRYARVFNLLQRDQDVRDVHSIYQRVLEYLPGEILLAHLGKHELKESYSGLLVF